MLLNRMSQANALVLDFGGVVSRTLFETHDLTEAALGLPAGSLSWRGPFCPESDPRAYALVTEGLGIKPKDCVFVDDQKRNIEGAKAFGMRTVHFDVKNPQVGYYQALTALGL